MQMRSFEAANMQEAMQMAREEMGEDAIILSTRSDREGGVTVTFALERYDEQPVEEAEALFSSYEPSMRMEGLPQRPASTAPQAGHIALDHPLASILAHHAVPEDIIQQILGTSNALRIPESAALHDLTDQLTRIFKQLYRFDPLPLDQSGGKYILVGPPGVGKTLTAAKLAAKLVIDRRPVHVISTDSNRAAATEQLLAFTRILGIDLQVASNRHELKSLLQNYGKDSHVIVDSPGCNPYDFQELKELGECAHVQDLEPILVCAAGTAPQEAIEIASVFSFLDIERILISRTDCARHYGSLLAAVKTGDYAFCMTTSSPRVMGELVAMQPDTLARLFTQYQRERIAA